MSDMIITSGRAQFVEICALHDDGTSEDILTFGLDEAVEFAAGVIGAAQNTARHQGLSNAEFNERFQAAMHRNAAEYATRSKEAS